MREFLLIQPEVGKVTEDGKDYYPEDVEPPSAEEVYHDNHGDDSDDRCKNSSNVKRH